jgi:hypothetical protein
MIKFKLNEKEYNLPECYDEVKLSTYIKVAQLESKRNMYDFEELYLINLLEVMCDAEPNELNDLSLEELQTMTTKLVFLKDDKFDPEKHIEIDGKDYAFIKSMSKMSLGEYVSIKTLCNGKDTYEALPYILAIILRPATREVSIETEEVSWRLNKFDAENIEYRVRLFQDLPISKVLGAVNFFLNTTE